MNPRTWTILGVIMLLAMPAGAEEKWRAEYKAGDLIEYKITDDLWQKGVVIDNVPGSVMHVELEEFVQGSYQRAGGTYIVYGKTDLRKRKAPVQGGEAEDDPAGVEPRGEPATPKAPGRHSQEEWRNRFQEGDLIEYKITDDLWQKGVVIDNVPGSVMHVELKEFVQGSYQRAGGNYIVYGKSDIRKPGAEHDGETAATEAKADPAKATVEGNPPVTEPDGTKGQDAAPSGHACLNHQPEGQVTRTATASYSLFQRLIYEQLRDQEIGRKVGITFTSLGVAEAYPNLIEAGVPRHMTAAPDTMIHRVKADYHYCVEYSDSILKYTVTEGYWLCFKDKAGDWVAAPDGKRDWKQEYLPK